MASRTLVELIDDVDGSVATTTVSFALDGTSYEIDLNDKNAAKLRDAIGKWIPSARKVSAQRRTAAGASRRGSSTASSPAIREWATANGYKVSARGRIPAEVTAAYEAAH